MLISSLYSFVMCLATMASLVRDGGLLPAVFNGSAIAPVLMGWFGPAPLLIPPNRTKHPSCSLDDFSASFVPVLPTCTVFNGTQFQHATELLSASPLSDTSLDTSIPHPTIALLDIAASLSSAPPSGISPRLSQEQPPPSSVPAAPSPSTIFDILLLIGFWTLVITFLILSLHPCTPVRSLASDFIAFISPTFIDIHKLPYRWVAFADEKAAFLRLIGILDQKAKKLAKQEAALEERVMVFVNILAELQRERKAASRTLLALRNSLLDPKTPELSDPATDDLQTNLRELKAVLESQVQIQADNKDLLNTVTILRRRLEEREQLLEQRDSQIVALQKELSARPAPTKPADIADNGVSSSQPDGASSSQPDEEESRPKPDGEKKLSWREKRYGPKKGKGAAKGSTQNGQGSVDPTAEISKAADSKTEVNATSSKLSPMFEAPESPVAEATSVIATTAVVSVSSTPSTQPPLPRKPVENTVSGDGSKAASSASSSAPPLLLPAREGGSGCDAGGMWSTSAAGQQQQPGSGNSRGHPHRPQPGLPPPHAQFRPPPSQHSRPPPHPLPHPPPHHFSHLPPQSHYPPPRQFPPPYYAQRPQHPTSGSPIGYPMPFHPQPRSRDHAGPFEPPRRAAYALATRSLTATYCLFPHPIRVASPIHPSMDAIQTVGPRHHSPFAQSHPPSHSRVCDVVATVHPTTAVQELSQATSIRNMKHEAHDAHH
ncbi:hypothetical protein EVG20_g5045 [Dentipellis fragilis]|uniref:Uncharacterized protein n=1 Tax=Dentipellis fragilis TaxID=205917 RepID=A0A4Y9YUD8_9AGAM|nr:hypothetical protein EVG20_g5045 [Dentipellis fragilis]